MIVDSQSTREDLVELVGTDPSRVDVVPLGLGAVRKGEPLPQSEVRSRFELGDRRVVLTLSAKRPHKNLAALISALAAIPAAERPLLVLPGYPSPHEVELRRHARELGIEDSVRFPAWVSAAELEGLWCVAAAFVFPSLYEGFGLPVLEAMARGVPVACSNASSLPEVAGDAALLFDPHDQSEIAAALRRVLDDRELRERLRARGVGAARQFSWERAADLTLASYRRALDAGSA